MEVDSIPQQMQERIAQIGNADLVIGILPDLDQDGVARACDGLGTLPGSPRVVVLHSDRTGSPTVDAGAAEGNASLRVLPWSALSADPAGSPMQSISAACQSTFEVGERLEARACCVLASKMDKVTSCWCCQLAQPLLEANFDLVLPCYAAGKLQGLLNRSIIYPLTRCLYGKRIQNPFGPDFGVARRLAQKILGINQNAKAASGITHPLAYLVPAAACDNLQICQARVGARVYSPPDWKDVSSLLVQVLGPIFLEMERRTPYWQKIRGSVAVPTFGEDLSVSQDTATVDINRMVETFQLGVRDLQEIWGLVLPPSTLFELRKLSRLAPEQVLMPDALWARIVFDFALAHRLRTINRDHLLRAMTPLYLAWVASYARELEGAGAAAVEQRIERLALAYEAAKPYLISRWRWPDRFNP